MLENLLKKVYLGEKGGKVLNFLSNHISSVSLNHELRDDWNEYGSLGVSDVNGSWRSIGWCGKNLRLLCIFTTIPHVQFQLTVS
ncbi:hypothetical protein F2Q68_00018377 [Brassica cretica]|uniref:Uncharacterized protein n=1 Tax=Brassica cretica TaxID=69181 RepID=A0A8S9HTU6_BRACR|nr:hypothetical protein F2Q68_00018377 [Brassica cretica]